MKLMRLFRIVYRIVWDYPRKWEKTCFPDDMKSWYWAGLSLPDALRRKIR